MTISAECWVSMMPSRLAKAVGTRPIRTIVHTLAKGAVSVVAAAAALGQPSALSDPDDSPLKQNKMSVEIGMMCAASCGQVLIQVHHAGVAYVKHVSMPARFYYGSA